MIPILLLVTATFRPAAPTVGDPITIRFAAAVTLDRSPDYEILSQRGNRVVIRSFQPHPFTISGRTGEVIFRNMVVPMHSVLKPNDDMAPAPLKPPRSEPYPRMPFMAIGIAALAAIAAWTFLALRQRAPSQAAVAAADPAERFRATVLALRPDTPRRWSKLADALREYLDATASAGRDLTTTEVVERLGARIDPYSAILHQGDLEKFSPWGPRPADFESLARKALEVAA